MLKSTSSSVKFLTAIVFLIVLTGTWFTSSRDRYMVASASVEAKPTPTPQNKVEVETSPTEAVVVITTPKPEKPNANQEEIEAYIRTIFGSDANVAVAVSHNECNPANPKYPECVLHTDHEYSVGIFQINLYNKSHWIHAKKVPGNTMEEKIEWLKNPYNNTLIAYKIFSDSGFNPWSAYTSGNYLNDL